MKKTILLAFLITLFAVPMLAQTPKSKPTLLRHVVLFQFKSSSSEAEVNKVKDAFMSLKGKISEIHDVEWGLNNSPEGLNQGLTHCFFVTFKSEKDRDTYLVHADHKKFVDVLGPHLEKAVVVDYWAKK
jgi:hypothetical protein